MDRNIFSKLKSFSHEIGKGITQDTLKVALTARKPWFERKLEMTLGQEYAKFEVAMERHRNALSMAEKHGNKEEIAREYRFLGNSFFKIEDYEMAISYYSKFLSIGSQNDIEEAWAYKILGLSHKCKRQYENALKCLKRCLQHYKKLENVKLERIEINANLGIVNNELENYKEAVGNFRESFVIARKLRSEHLKQQIHMLLGVTQWMLNQIPDVYICFEHACHLAEDLNDGEKIAQACVLFGTFELEQDDPQKAQEHLSISMEEAIRAGSIKTLTLAYLKMGDAYVTVDKPQEAIKHYKQFLESDEIDESEQATATLKMAACYKDCYDYKSAIECCHEGLRLSLKLNDKRKTECEARESLGISYYDEGDYKQAQEHCKEVWTIANAQKYTQLQGRVDIILGDVFCIQGNVSDGRAHYQEALGIAQSLHDKKMEARANHGLGDVTLRKERLKTKLRMALMESREKRIRELVGRDNKLHDGKASHQRHIEAIQHMKKANPTSSPKMSYELISRSNYNMKSDVEVQTELTEASDAHFRQAIAQEDIGCVNAKSGQFQNAAIDYQHGLNIISRCDDSKNLESTINSDLGHFELENIGYLKAPICEEKYLVLANSIKDKLQQARAHEERGNIFFAKRVWEKRQILI